MDFLNIYSKYSYFKESYGYIKENYPEKVNIFIDNIEKAEKETFKSLLNTTINERVLNFTSPLIVLLPNSTNIIPFTSEEYNKIIYHEISLKVIDVFSFNYFNFDHPVLYRKIYNVDNNSNNIEEWITLENCIDFVELFNSNSLLQDIEDYKEEIVQSIANMALVYTLWSFSFTGNQDINWKFLSDYADHKSKLDPYFDKYLFYCQLHLISHQHHPSRKNRIGISCDEMIKYSYEFGNEIQLQIIGLHRSVGEYIFIDESIDPTEYFFTQFPSLKQSILDYFNKNNLIIDQYLIYPIHPISASKFKQSEYKEDFENKLIISFPQEINIPSFSTESYRSLIVKSQDINRLVPNIKVSIPIRISGAIRIIAKQSFQTMILVSKTMEKIFELESSRFKDRIGIVREFGGIYHKDGTISCMKYNILSMGYKDNLKIFIKSNEEQHISSCFLFNRSPIGYSSTVIKEIIHQYHEYHGIPNQMTLDQSLRAWYKKYINLLLEPVLLLMTKYGISIESHLQNVIFVFIKGEPVRLILRDWLASVIKHDRLNSHQSKVNGLSFKDVPEFPDYLDFYSVFMNCILYHHIGQINILIFEEFKGISSLTYKELWKTTSEIMKSIFVELEKECDLCHIKEDVEVLFNNNLSFQTAGIISRLIIDKKNWVAVKRNNPLVDF